MSSNLRSELRRRRRGVGDPERREAAAAVAERVAELAEFSGAPSIAAYVATDGELDPAPLIDLCRQQDRQVLLPVVVGADMAFVAYGRRTRLVDNRWGIPEPAGGETVAPGDIGAVLVPLVGFDAQRNRLGRGLGYYDRTFGFSPRPPLIGLAFELQRLDSIESSPADVRLDVVATETAIYR